jgi:hypothetical protein
MPATYHIDTYNQVVFSTATGCFTDADIFGHDDRLRADPLFQPHFCQLLDGRGVEVVGITAEGVRRMAEWNPFGGGAKRAFVADRQIMYGYARMFEILSEDRTQNECRVFTDIDEARKWLGLE